MSIKQAIEAWEDRVQPHYPHNEIRSWQEFGTVESAMLAEIKELRAALAALRSMPEPVHQYRVPGCSTWYDGHADHLDGGGPYEERTLFATPHTAPVLSDAEMRTGWMCATTFRHEVGEAAGGSPIYPDLDDLKENEPCWESCGVVQVEVRAIERAVLGRGGEKL